MRDIGNEIATDRIQAAHLAIVKDQDADKAILFQRNNSN